MMKIKSRFFLQPSWNNNLTHVIIFLQFFTIISLSKLSFSQECQTISECKCKFPNGSIIDLTSLGYHNSPRWQDIKPVKNEPYSYSYNPCFKFTLGNGACHNVAVCQRNDKDAYDCGTFAHFSSVQYNNTHYVNYVAANGQRTTNVTLVCSPTAWEPQLVVQGEVSPNTGHYQMTLTSRCACADLCRESHLSAGSVLVILFMICVSLYLILGIIHSSLTRGAHGWELIPHYEFWVDFPLLVRDGCVFVISGCKPETAYERI